MPGQLNQIMGMLGGPSVGIGGGGSPVPGPGFSSPQSAPFGGQQKPFPSFEQWLQGIFGGQQPPPEQLAGLHQQYQREKEQYERKAGADTAENISITNQIMDMLRNRGSGNVSARGLG